MKNSKCIYSKASYYGLVYLAIVSIGVGIGLLNNYFGWGVNLFSLIGFSSLIIPSVPFMDIFLHLNMVVTDGTIIFPTDMALFFVHLSWFIFFYLVYLSYLLLKNRCKAC